MKNQKVIQIVGLKLTLSGGLKDYRGLFEAKAVIGSLMFWKKEGISVKPKNKIVQVLDPSFSCMETRQS